MLTPHPCTLTGKHFKILTVNFILCFCGTNPFSWAFWGHFRSGTVGHLPDLLDDNPALKQTVMLTWKRKHRSQTRLLIEEVKAVVGLTELTAAEEEEPRAWWRIKHPHMKKKWSKGAELHPAADPLLSALNANSFHPHFHYKESTVWCGGRLSRRFFTLIP